VLVFGPLPRGLIELTFVVAVILAVRRGSEAAART